MIESKTLLFVAGGRDFPLFWDWVYRVNFIDKLIIRYHLHHDATAMAQKYFMEHDYDYLIVTTDDLLGTPEHVRMLLEDEEKHNFPIISGWCDGPPASGLSGVSQLQHDGIHSKVSTFKSYHFIPMSDIFLGKLGFPFFKVWFNGLPLTLIKKEVLKEVPIRPFIHVRDSFCVTPETKAKGRGVMLDLQFCIDCAAKKIPITIDSRIFLLHFGLRSHGLAVGHKPSKIEFVKATT